MHNGGAVVPGGASRALTRDEVNMRVFFQLCWIVSFVWLIIQWVLAWKAYIRCVGRRKLWLIAKIPPVSFFFDKDHRRTATYAALDSFMTIGSAQIIVEIVPGVGAAGVGAIVGLALSIAIRHALKEMQQLKAHPG